MKMQIPISFGLLLRLDQFINCNSYHGPALLKILAKFNLHSLNEDIPFFSVLVLLIQIAPVVFALKEFLLESH